MRLDKILVILIAVVLVAAAVVAVVKLTGSPEPAPVVVVNGGGLELVGIGIQGLEWRLVERLTAEGRLPNLARLVDEGAVGSYSTLGRHVDPRIVWTCLVTGVSPENQGVGGKVMSPRGEPVDAPLTPASRTVGTVWTALQESGRTCAVLGWPGTWPVEDFGGIMVGPHSTYVLERKHRGDPADAISPVSLHASLDPLVVTRDAVQRRDLARFINEDSWLGLEALLGQNYIALADAYAADRSMTDVALRVTSDSGVAGVLVCLGGADIVAQRFWHYMETEAIMNLEVDEDETLLLERQIEALGNTIELYYDCVDELVGEVVALAGEGATIAIFTDHGYSGIPFDETGNPKIGTHMHSEEGFWIIAGPGVAAGARADHGELLDVAPTVMAAASIPRPDVIEGRAHEEVLAR